MQIQRPAKRFVSYLFMSHTVHVDTRAVVHVCPAVPSPNFPFLQHMKTHLCLANQFASSIYDTYLSNQSNGDDQVLDKGVRGKRKDQSATFNYLRGTRVEVLRSAVERGKSNVVCGRRAFQEWRLVRNVVPR